MNLKEGLLKARDFLRTRQQAYQQTFSGQFAERVLADLAWFCRGNSTTFHPDDRVHAALEGRREVWIRICHHLKLDPEQLWKTYGRKDLE